MNALAKLLSTVLLNILGQMLSDKVLTQLVSHLVVDGLSHLKEKDLLKNTSIDNVLLDQLIGSLKNAEEVK